MRQNMGAEPDDVGRHVALAAPSRRRLLDVLRAAREPAGAEELAAAVGLHVTTARHHLQALERAGLVQRSGERAQRPGRPRLLYAATAPPDPDASRRKLADVLATALGWDDDGGRGRAERAGRAWAEREIPEPSAPASPDEAVRVTQRLFDQLGFAPQLVRSGAQQHLRLGACPFRDVARAHPEAVCTVHLGLLRGALERLGRPDLRADLRPFVEPELCIADIAVPDVLSAR